MSENINKEVEMPETLNPQEEQITAEKILERIKAEIQKLEDKTFTTYFYVIDTKGVPSGSLLYIYKIAYALQEKGYKVAMLYSDKEFVGISGWAEKKYADLPHLTLTDKKIKISPSDFLIIPEIYTDVMSQTKGFTGKRVILLQNDEYFTRFIPIGVNPYKYGITDAIVNTDVAKDWMEKNLPLIKTHKIRPNISTNLFHPGDKPKKLIINFVCKDGNDASRIVKPFMWKYPQFKWVSFTQLNNLPQDVFAKALQDGFLTIWVDENASFGYVPLEALKAGSLVIGKIPQKFPEWMLKEDGKSLVDSIIWFDDFSVVPDLLMQLISMWIRDGLSKDIYEEAAQLKDAYSGTEQTDDINTVFVDTLFANRKRDFEKLLQERQNNKEK